MHAMSRSQTEVRNQRPATFHVKNNRWRTISEKVDISTCLCLNHEIKNGIAAHVKQTADKIQWDEANMQPEK